MRKIAAYFVRLPQLNLMGKGQLDHMIVLELHFRLSIASWKRFYHNQRQLIDCLIQS
jgi:hypothetical protein